MIPNATLTRVDAPAAGSTGGDAAWTNGAAVSIDVTFDAPSNSQRFTLGAAVREATGVVYIMKEDLVAAEVDAPLSGGRMLVTIGTNVNKLYRVVYVVDRELDDLSHWEVYVRTA